MEFEDISPDEAVQALFLHSTAGIHAGPISKATYNLIFRPKKEIRLKLASLDDFNVAERKAIRDSITIDDYETIFTGRSSADFSDPAVFRRIVGDLDLCVFDAETEFPELGAKVPGFLSVTKQVSLTFTQALRDVVAEFHNNRTNPLLTLLRSKSGEIDAAALVPIVDKVRDLNGAIEGLEDVQAVRKHIRQTIKDTAGETYAPMSLSIRSDLPEEKEQLFQSVRLFVGESKDGYEGTINELSLGGANLIYLTLKLLEFKYQREKLPDSSATAKAIDYSLKRWAALTRYLDDPMLPIDNNWIENRIRPVALGRSNWLFAGSLRAGRRAAAVMTLIQSAKLNGLEPWAYLKDVLTRLSTQPASRIAELLPPCWAQPT